MLEFSVPNLPAGLTDPAADAKSDDCTEERQERQQSSSRGKLPKRNDGDDGDRTRWIEHPRRSLGPAVVFLKPLCAGRVGHRLDAVCGAITVFHHRPNRQAADEDNCEPHTLRGSAPQQQAQDQSDHSQRSRVNREWIQQDVNVFGLFERLEKIVEQRLFHNLGVGNHADAIAADELAFDCDRFCGVLG